MEMPWIEMPSKFAIIKRSSRSSFRHCSGASDPGDTCCTRCWFVLLVILAHVLLVGVAALCLYWVCQFHTPEVRHTYYICWIMVNILGTT